MTFTKITNQNPRDFELFVSFVLFVFFVSFVPKRSSEMRVAQVSERGILVTCVIPLPLS
jgi:hypothetical protein